MSFSIERRRLLKAVGLGSVASMPVFRPGRMAAAQTAVPRRLACVFFQNGVPQTWWPQKTGQSDVPLAGVTLSRSLSPLEPFKSRMLLVGGLEDGGDGGHTNGWSVFSAFAGSGGRPPVGAVTIDQHVARVISTGVRYPSGLQFSTPPMSSWHHAFSAGQGGLPTRTNPAAAFMEIFGNLARPAGSGTGAPSAADAAELEALRLERKSVLDYISKELAAASAQLGGTHRAMMDSHLTSIRELEKRLADESAPASLPASVGTSCQSPTAITYTTPSCRGDAQAAACMASFDPIARHSLEMMALAMACGLTRVATFQFGGTADQNTYPWLEGSRNSALDAVVSGDVIRGHHGASHAESTPAARAWLEEITQYHARLLADFCKKLDAFKMEDGRTLLDHSLTYVANECGNGASHSHRNIPVLLLGGCGGKVKTGRWVSYPDQAPARPIADLLVTLANLHGSTLTKVGNMPEAGAPPSRGIPYQSRGPLVELLA